MTECSTTEKLLPLVFPLHASSLCAGAGVASWKFHWFGESRSTRRDVITHVNLSPFPWYFSSTAQMGGGGQNGVEVSLAVVLYM